MKSAVKKAVALVSAVILLVLPLCTVPAAASPDYEIYGYKTGEASENGYAPLLLLDENGDEISLEEIAQSNSLELSTMSAASDYALPEAYDSRDHGYITSVKIQQSSTCWAHAATACLEASYLKQGLTGIESPDFSEMHMAWSFYLQKTDNEDDPTYGDGSNQPTMPLESGGNEQAAFSVLARWSGAASQTDYPQKASASTTKSYYLNNMTYEDRYAAQVHLENYIELPNTVYEIKQAIIDNGAVCISYASAGENYPYYYPDGQIDHSILVVGWDDSFSAEEFDESCRPGRDGAWLCKNSWGVRHGDGGYFWMSYDQTPYSKFFCYTADADFYDNNYQYCGSTPSFYSTTGTEPVLSANVFTADGNEILEAVGIYLPIRNTDYKVEIYTGLPSDYSDPVTDGTLVSSVSGTKEHSGYYTAELDTPVYLEAGEIFSVVLSADSPWTASRFIAIGNKYYENYENRRGYIYKSGVWRDAASFVSNDVYIRAFTVDIPEESGFTVDFVSCTGETVATELTDLNGTVSLPEAPDGYVYEFLLDGAEFRGRGICGDTAVTVHKLKIGEAQAQGCSLNAACELCGGVLSDTAQHSFEQTDIFDWNCKRTEKVCTRCGFYETEFDFPTDTVYGITGGHTAWYLDTATGDFYVVGRGEVASSVTAAATADYGWQQYIGGIRYAHIGNEITSLPVNFLSGATKLKTVEILGKITEIPSKAFAGCSALTSVDLPETVVRISDNAFSNSGLTSIEIPEKTEYIGSQAFLGCSSLTQVTGLEGIRKIGTLAFMTSAVSGTISLPSCLESIGDGAFSVTYSLERIDIDPVCEAYRSCDGKYILTADGTELVYYSSCAADEVFAVPDSVRTVCAYTFNKNIYLKYVELPEVTAVGDYAFQNTKLTGVGFGSSENITLSNSAFKGSDSITAMYLPANATDFSLYSVGFTDRGTVNKAFTLYCESGSAAEEYAVTYGVAYSVEHTEHTIEHRAIVEATCLGDGIRCGICGVCCHVENACEVYSVNGAHTYEWIYDLEPDCTETGIMHGVCIHCGFTGEENTVAPENGHSFEWVTDTAATCEETGIWHEECTVCGITRSEGTEIPAEGHVFRWVVDVEMTCGDDGIKHEECTVCGLVQSENTAIPTTHQHSTIKTDWYGCRPYGLVKGSKVCIDCGTVVSGDEVIVKDTPHSYVLKTTLEPTCTQEGCQQYVCKYCFDVQDTKYTLAAKHTLTYVTVTEATCSTYGKQVYKCEYCDYVEEGKEKTLALNSAHSYKWVIDTAAGCESGGIRHQECAACGAVASENTVISATGHKYEWITDKEATCTNPGVKHQLCTVCGKTASENTEIPQLDHTYEWAVDLEPTCGAKGIRHQVCTVCGGTASENTPIASTGEHMYEWVTDRYADCVNKGSMHLYCSCCNGVAMRNTEIPVLDHAAGDWEYSSDGVFVKKCTGCGGVFEQAAVTLSFECGTAEVENASEFSAKATAEGLDGLNIIYYSSNVKAVAVNSDGTAVAVGTGSAVITAEIENTDITAVLEITVVPREFTVVWNTGGEQTVCKIKEGEPVTVPENPVSEGLYFAGWTPAVPAVMPPYDLDFTAVFKEYDVSKIRLSILQPSTVSLSYGESVTLYASVSGVPEGAIIKWYVEGEGVKIETDVTGRVCTVTSVSSGDAVIYAYVADKDGRAISDLDGKRIGASQHMQSDANLWLRILYVIRQIFGRAFPVLQKITKI